jgi:DNA helicase-2/ATP-dependent DNA helicase PcrA
MFELSEQKKQLIKTEGNLLVLGGPGSGKTTIALLKAKRIIEEEGIKRGQVVLFLSFARATISRVEEQVGVLISYKIRSHLEINTYHGFIWNLLKCHGYLSALIIFHSKWALMRMTSLIHMYKIRVL